MTWKDIESALACVYLRQKDMCKDHLLSIHTRGTVCSLSISRELC